MIRPAIETVLAALLIGAALALLIHGPDGALVGLYGLASPEHRTWLWHALPPEHANLGYPGKALGALAALLPGLWFAIGVWAGHPGWRTCLLWAVAVALAWVVWTFLRTLDF